MAITSEIIRLDLGATGGTQTMLLELGRPVHFIAWGTITKIDPLHALNGNDYAALDIPEVNGIPTTVLENLGTDIDGRHVGALEGVAQNLLLRLRSNLFSGGGNLSCAAEFVVLLDL